MPAWNVRFDLPLDLEDDRLLIALARATALAETIRRVPVTPFVRERLNRLNIVRAVHGTTAIEGANLSEADVSRIVASTAPALGPRRQTDETEVRNADATMRFIANILKQDPFLNLTEDLIRQFNRLLTQGVASPEHMPGRYRTINVSAASYQAPGPELVASLMSHFIAWLDSEEAQSWPAVARAVAAHFYVVSIHPFADGNGRTARAIESFLLYQAQVNVFGFYSLANFYYRHRPRYMELLDEVRFSAVDLTPFVLFAVDGLIEELQAVHGELMNYVAGLVRRNFADEALGRRNLSTKTKERLSKILTYLEREPVALRSLRSGEHALSELYRGVSLRTLERDLDLLERLGLLNREAGVLTLSDPPTGANEHPHLH